MDLSREIGRALRNVRIARGLTLRSAARASEGRFKPSSIAGYERGERAITVQRFCDLARIYDTDPARLLGGIVSEALGEAQVEVDLPTLRRLDIPEAESLREFADRVRAARSAAGEEVITLRYADLEVIARASGRERDELLDLLAAAAHRRPA
ncbi:MAG TPA: helix-turn-helix transcriptional regulator [Actinomycetota bacterium]